MENEKYHPIDCSFYDRLEEAATLRRRVEIRYRADGDAEHAVHGRIVDLAVREGAEWLTLESGFVLRLDRILSMDGVPMPGVC